MFKEPDYKVCFYWCIMCSVFYFPFVFTSLFFHFSLLALRTANTHQQSLKICFQGPFLKAFSSTALHWRIWLIPWDPGTGNSTLIWVEAMGTEVHPRHQTTSERGKQDHGTLQAPSLKQKVLIHGSTCPACWMRPWEANLSGRRWMCFTPFEPRKIWSCHDVNWCPLALLSSWEFCIQWTVF